MGRVVIGSIMFGMAIGGFVDNGACQANLAVTAEERVETILLLENGQICGSFAALETSDSP